MTVRWGIVGPGRIARKVAADFVHVPDAEVVAVASRSKERAAAFAADVGARTVHDSYRAIVEDPEVDVLYIATPHPLHRAVALAGLRAGKALLVEKAFTVTPEATREIAALAAERGAFVMEAMWTRFQPAIARMRELIADGAIGDVMAVQADLGAQQPSSPDDRFYNLALGGGALFDLSVYPISFAQMVLGNPETVTVHGQMVADGVDVEEAILLGYPEGRSATLFASLRCQSPGMARVVGTGGWIEVPPRFHHPSRLLVHRNGHEPEELHLPATGAGYSHEIAEVTEGVKAGLAESAVMPLADTVAVQDIMGRVADKLGMAVAEGPADLEQ
ncbi:Gfo/Idh/MocA family oxidoreductase [Pseudonocardia sp. RS11V-5]|uniref:Gfo/Idh/MocA family protein n=1 Tax=Pseudonocardia terrae TaxID=2905831 RepID=UPI001E3EBF09|nr:Gfo/Idh/MocA family oxidoreductase [Pseudonocardia terrae]MCE3552597.1 Gfo/Idh/MocA family oxidoreductase [Pseudonocardia terrae]